MFGYSAACRDTSADCDASCPRLWAREHTSNINRPGVMYPLDGESIAPLPGCLDDAVASGHGGAWTGEIIYIVDFVPLMMLAMKCRTSRWGRSERRRSSSALRARHAVSRARVGAVEVRRTPKCRAMSSPRFSALGPADCPTSRPSAL